MRRILVVFWALFILMSSASLYAMEAGFYGKISYLDWSEYVENSRRDPFVHEFGPIYSLGSSVLFHPTEKIFSQLGLEIFGGKISYQGSYIADQSSHDTTGFMRGLSAEWTTGYNIIKIENFFSSLFVTLGVSAWQREVCAENWYTAYTKLGLKIEMKEFFVKAGLLIPLYTEMDAGIEDVYWLNRGRKTYFSLNPRGIPTPFFEVGIQKKRLSVSLFYELRKWEESDRIYFEGGSYIFQPETVQSIIGLRFGIYF